MFLKFCSIFATLFTKLCYKAVKNATASVAILELSLKVD